MTMNNNKPTFRDLLSSARGTVTYIVERTIIGFTEQVVARISSLGLARGEFASKLESSPAYVTKLLRGGTNFTIESMVKVAEALDSELKIELVPKVSVKEWFSELEKMTPQPRPEQTAWAIKRSRTMASDNAMFIGPRMAPQLFNDETVTLSY
jgi:transcriptional regulator with XRE-family HTH domain